MVGAHIIYGYIGRLHGKLTWSICHGTITYSAAVTSRFMLRHLCFGLRMQTDFRLSLLSAGNRSSFFCRNFKNIQGWNYRQGAVRCANPNPKDFFGFEIFDSGIFWVAWFNKGLLGGHLEGIKKESVVTWLCSSANKVQTNMFCCCLIVKWLSR